uniref:Exonuclease domain-containing protein n=1 Tax=Rhabditophanes sp. KR3021 TaxID=114890 RepID=A0AC35TSF2_9BILA
MSVSTEPSFFPKNVTSDYFKARIESYNKHIIDSTDLTKMVATLLPNFTYYAYRRKYIYDFPTFRHYCPPPHDEQQVRNPITTLNDQPTPAFEDKDLGGSICINCGHIFKFDRKLEKMGVKQKCVEKDGIGNVVKEHPEHQKMSIPSKEKFTFRDAFEKDEANVKRTLITIHCDLVYTIEGVVVASCYIVDHKFDLILDETVKVDQRIVNAHHPLNNYLKTKNINKNGITVKQLRDKIFKLIDKETIIVGFDLAPILRTLRIVHVKIVDLAYQIQFLEYKDSLFNYLKNLAQKSEDIVSKKDGAKTCTELMATSYMTLLCLIYLDKVHGRDDSILLSLNKKEEQTTDETSDSDNDFEDIEFEFDESCHIYDKYRKPLIINNYKRRQVYKEVKKGPNNLELNFILPPKDAVNSSGDEDVKTDNQKYIEIKRNIPRNSLWKAHDLDDVSESEDDYVEESSSIPAKTTSRLYQILEAKIPTNDQDIIRCGFPVFSAIKSKGEFVLANTFSRYKGKAFLGANQTNVECAKCNKVYEIDSDFNQVNADDTCISADETEFENVCAPHYMKTLPFDTKNTFESPPSAINQSNSHVLVISSSIVYTTHGPEIAKLIVMRVTKFKLLDTLIKVENKVIEYDFQNTNLTCEDIDVAEIDREEARSKLYNLMSTSTILVGYNLALTLRCLRVVHENVVELHWLQSNSPIKKNYPVIPFDTIFKNTIAENDNSNLLLNRSFATCDVVTNFLNTKKDFKKQKHAKLVNTAEYDNELRDCARIEQNAYRRFLW